MNVPALGIAGLGFFPPIAGTAGAGVVFPAGAMSTVLCTTGLTALAFAFLTTRLRRCFGALDFVAFAGVFA